MDKDILGLMTCIRNYYNKYKTIIDNDDIFICKDSNELTLSKFSDINDIFNLLLLTLDISINTSGEKSIFINIHDLEYNKEYVFNKSKCKLFDVYKGIIKDYFTFLLDKEYYDLYRAIAIIATKLNINNNIDITDSYNSIHKKYPLDQYWEMTIDCTNKLVEKGLHISDNEKILLYNYVMKDKIEDYIITLAQIITYERNKDI